ncbi:hypothetical protein B0T22DRAFT_439904 [Podospora appendiculata]|uniref:Uncharacterized protein n=1 Tax=Podospora appendiculata TaxID=314037 RepID=A0AAE1CCC2_9PEZI|nr:hypothetical protein B0T22DRAFT_439904 [Podospora appendiculata]
MPVMWDRLRTTGPPRQQFGHTKMSSATRGYSYSITSGPAPPRPPREFLEQEYGYDYETAPAVQEPPPRNPKRLALRTSTFRPSSSVYSGYEPPVVNRPVAKLASRQGHRYGGVEDISPPSSPEPDDLVADQQGDVSPIDEELPNLAQLALASSRNPRTDQRNVEQYQEAPQQHPEANIPMMRRARRNEALASHPPPQNTRQQEPRWDPLTGERTSSPRGYPSQVKPAEFAHGLGITTRISSSAGQKAPPVATSSFGDRVRRMAKKAGGKENRDPDPAAGAFTSSRPGWRGASGRTTIVDPVRDDPQVAPLRIPDKTRRIISQTSAPVSAPKPHPSLAVSQRGQTPPVSPPSGSETHAGSGLRDMTAKVVPLSQLSPAATKPYAQGSHGIPSSPLSPNLPGGDAPSVAARELARSGLANKSGYPPSSPASPSVSHSPRESPNAIRRKPPPTHANHDHQHQESVSSAYSQQSEAPPAPHPHPLNDPWVQPASRFSITTYATSAAATPRESLDDFDHSQPPMPALPRELSENPNPIEEESVMDRRRPRLEGASDDRPSPIYGSANENAMSSPFSNNESQAARDRKAAVSGSGAQPPVAVNPNLARMRNMTAAERRISTASSINKVLPLAPPETTAEEARDRVGMLNAQLVSLGNRRININRSIKQMTELMPTDNLMDSGDVIRKRELEKKKVEALKQELSEVQREEYELGLKLHRAYKRLDKNADFEPTTLWVRRVTN